MRKIIPGALVINTLAITKPITTHLGSLGIFNPSNRLVGDMLADDVAMVISIVPTNAPDEQKRYLVDKDGDPWDTGTNEEVHGPEALVIYGSVIGWVAINGLDVVKFD